MSGVLAVMDADIRYTQLRVSKHQRKADSSAARKGGRDPGADSHCEWVEHVFAEKLKARAAVAELIESCDAEYAAMGRHLARPTDDNREAYFDAMQRRRAALARVKGDQA